MLELLSNYALFAAKTITIVTVITIPFFILLSGRKNNRKGQEPTVIIRHVNEKIDQTIRHFDAIFLSEKDYKKKTKAAQKQEKINAKKETKPKTFLCSFTGDIKASGVSQLREEITMILSVAKPDDEVLLVLESGGGTIHGYGLAASQLNRIKEKNIQLKISVDSIAASGGYMMACVADELIAAPFAIIGSIGVVAQIPNFHRLLKDKNIDFEQITAGDFKRTLTMFGNNTDVAREKFQSEIDTAHELFKQFVAASRPLLDMEKVATGEHWFGTTALELGLIDKVSTSDDLILDAVKSRDVYKIEVERKTSLFEKVTNKVTALLYS
jgi:serine protease SohB